MDFGEMIANASIAVLVASALAILGLRVSIGSPSRQADLNRTVRLLADDVTRSCLVVRRSALGLEAMLQDERTDQDSYSQYQRRTDVELARQLGSQAEALIRSTTLVVRGAGKLRNSDLQKMARNISTLKAESHALLASLQDLEKKVL